MNERNVVYFPHYRRPEYLQALVEAYMQGGMPGLRRAYNKRTREIDLWMRRSGGTDAQYDEFVERMCRHVDAEISRRLASRDASTACEANR